jgi:hypothetical protein
MMRGRIQVTYHAPQKFIQTADERDAELADDIDELLSPREKENLREMIEFDQRIAKLKEEVAEANFSDSSKRFSDVPAQESPGVRNLPHTSITPRITPNMVEIAD